MEVKKYESIFDKTDIHSIYNESRKLHPEVIDKWLNKVKECVGNEKIKTIIDLGCGTGRFTKSLADCFSCEVVGIDPSLKMLSVAKETIGSPIIHFIEGAAENIPAGNESIDLIFLSQIYHHILDKNKFVKECNRVLDNGGYVCIRNSSIDNMDSYLYPRFFPSAMEIDMKRLPRRKAILEQFKNNCFHSLFCGAVTQEFARNHREYFEKVRMRGCSDLAAIDDNEFNEGLKKLKEYCEKNNSNEPVLEEIDLLIFKKDENLSY